MLNIKKILIGGAVIVFGIIITITVLDVINLKQSTPIGIKALSGPVGIGPSHGFIGINFVDDTTISRLPIVKSVASGSSAEKSGLRNGDIILKIDNNEVKTVSEIQEITSKLKPKEIIKITCRRDNEIIIIDVSLMSYQELLELEKE